jgi:hypothetical protein
MEVKINCADVSEVIPTAEVTPVTSGDLEEVEDSDQKRSNICREGRFHC